MNAQTFEAHVNAWMYRMNYPQRTLYPSPALPIFADLKKKYAHIGNDFWSLYNAFEEDVMTEAKKRVDKGLRSFYLR